MVSQEGIAVRWCLTRGQAPALRELDELLRPVTALQAHSRNRPVDKAAVKGVLLEAVAQAPYPHPEPVATWGLKAPCNKDWSQQQGILASVQNPCHSVRNDQPMAQGTWLVSVRDIWLKVQGYAKIEPAPS